MAAQPLPLKNQLDRFTRWVDIHLVTCFQLHFSENVLMYSAYCRHTCYNNGEVWIRVSTMNLLRYSYISWSSAVMHSIWLVSNLVIITLVAVAHTDNLISRGTTVYIAWSIVECLSIVDSTGLFAACRPKRRRAYIHTIRPRGASGNSWAFEEWRSNEY